MARTHAKNFQEKCLLGRFDWKDSTEESVVLVLRKMK